MLTLSLGDPQVLVSIDVFFGLVTCFQFPALEVINLADNILGFKSGKGFLVFTILYVAF